MSFYLENNDLYFDNQYIDEVYSSRVDNEHFGCTLLVENILYLDDSIFDTLKSQDFIEDVWFMNRYKRYHCQIGKKAGIVHIQVYFLVDLLEWTAQIPVKIFLSSFSQALSNKGYISNIMDDSVDGPYIEVEVTTLMDNNETFLERYTHLEKVYQITFEEVLIEKCITKTIQFTPEHFSAGTSILQYFGKLLQEKHPDENVSVSIKQEGLKVSMTIETPDGKKEEIEEYLNKFGMVITNQMTPQEFTSNPIQVLELETKLKSAEMEIGFQKKLLALQDKTYDENLVSLKDEVKYLREELSALRVSNNENIQMLLQSLQIKDKLVNKLSKAINSKNQEETKTLLLELKEKDEKGYISLKEHIDSAIVGGIINAPSWIQFIITHFPK